MLFRSRQWAGAIAVIITLAITGTTVFWGLSGLGVDIEAIVHHDHMEEQAIEHEHEHDNGDTQDWWALPAIIAAFIAPGIIFETVLTFLILGLLMRLRPQLVDIRVGRT